MKKSILLTISAIICAAITGCASTKIEPAALSPAAIITIKGNGSLPWFEIINGKESSANEGLIDSMINSRAYSDDPEISTAIDRLEYADESIRRNLGEQLNIEFVEKQTLVNSKWYKRLNEGFFSSIDTSIKPEGYKDISSLDKIESQGISKETLANSFIFLKYEFFKEVISGSKINGKVAPFIRMTVTIRDAKGKELMYKIYKIRGTDAIRIMGRDYDKAALAELYYPLIDQLAVQFAISLM